MTVPVRLWLLSRHGWQPSKPKSERNVAQSVLRLNLNFILYLCSSLEKLSTSQKTTDASLRWDAAALSVFLTFMIRRVYETNDRPFLYVDTLLGI
jgi:hypothetical protein